jgi:pimeloyl-ACP methyl ester carboxylesterase
MIDQRHVKASDGRELYVRSFGKPTDRAAVVCLPGLTRNHRDFVPLAEALSHDRLVVTTDLRGRGRSDYDATGASYRPEVYVDDVIRILDELGIDRAVFVGTSLGGSVAMAVAAAHPSRVAGLVLNDVGPKLEPEGFARIQSYAGKLPAVSTWDEVVTQLQAVNAPMVGTISDEDWHQMARQQWREFATGQLRPDHDPAVAASMAAVDPNDIPTSWPVFESIGPIPILVLRGEVSDLFAASTAEEMQRRHPGTTVVTIAQRGHCPTLDEPESRAAIAKFLADLGSGE